MSADFEKVFDYWFGDGPLSADRIKFWFMKSDETDRQIEEQFGETVKQALAGDLDDWAETPRGRVALVIVLDQFTRNIYRGTPRAFAGDAVAHGLTLEAIEQGLDTGLELFERFFLYMPLEHQEDIHLQEMCIGLMSSLAEASGPDTQAAFDNIVDYARKHREVIAEFGRFPHRNPIYGRPSTAEEEAYLSKPGAGF